MRRKITNPLTVTVSVAFTVIFCSAASAQTTSSASYNAYNAAFLVQTGGQTYYSNSYTDRTPAFMWGQASDIFVAEDYYGRTHSPAAALLIGNLLNTFMANNKADWSWDSWNDDIAWGVIAFVHGYQITGNTAFLNAAAGNWNMAVNRGLSDIDAGGVWENQDKWTKCALSNDPFVISGCALYQITGNSEYLNESKAMYDWVRTSLVNTTGSPNSLGEPGQVNEGLTKTGALQPSDNVYNDGSFAEAADCLYRITGDIEYHDDALRTITHVVNKQSVIDFVGNPGNPQYAYWFVKALSEFCTDNHQWPKYYAWMLANANAAWNNRDSLGVTEDDWLNLNANPNPCALNASSAVSIWQYLTVPQQYRIVNKYSGLAMDLIGGNQSSGAAISQLSAGAASKAEQQWVLAPVNSHFAMISAITGMAATIEEGSIKNGAQLVDSTFSTDNPAQQFDLVPQGHGYFLIKNVKSGLELDDAKAGTSDGTPIVQWSANGLANQLWKLTSPSD